MHIIVREQLAEIDPRQWNAMLSDNNPFMRHEFLSGLELCNCVSSAHGWHPQHICIYEDATEARLLGAMPCYRKDHSYGEYIFDWAWADAHHRHGLEYYPKLSNAVPFTPATGPRWLLATDADEQQISEALICKALELVKQQGLSSFHSLFTNQQQATRAAQLNLAMRLSTQFHWKNKNYQDFAKFLAKLSSKKRKNIKRERRRVIESGVEFQWLTGASLNASAVDQMYQFYSRTIQYYGAQSYLNRCFFQYLADNLADHTLFLFAQHQGKIIAGGLYLKSDTTLYGRYWGALDNFHSIHFETCYYQPIQWCIENKYQTFEAGAQGEHKLARGLEPTTTYSAHWIAQPQFRAAIDNFLLQEEHQINRYQEALLSHSPFKREL